MSPLRLSSAHLRLLAAILGAGLLAAPLFVDALFNLVSRWQYQAEYSHGFLIPLVAAYILWDRRVLLGAHWGRGHPLAVPLALAALLIAVIGEISALYLLLHYALLVWLLALALALLGRGVRHMLPAWLLLFFAVPLPYVIEVALTAKMQLLSSQLGVGLIRAVGIPVHLSGNVIDLGALKLHVVEACSGLRYLFPLVSLGFALVCFYRAAAWKKVVVVLSTVPITIALNSLRIGITGVLVELGGQASAQGFLHDFEGWVVFVLCLILLVLEIVVLERLSGGAPLIEVFRPRQYVPVEVPASAPRIAPLLCLAGLSALASGVTLVMDTRALAQPDNESFAAFPMRLAGWQGERSRLDLAVVEAIDASDYLMADYIGDDGVPVNFYVAYYANQRKGVSPHSPKVCIPGGGWEIAELTRIETDAMPVNRVVIRRGQQAQLVYYWFVERGRVVANEYRKKWWLLRDVLRFQRSEGALVRVITPLGGAETPARAEQRLREFIAVAHPQLMRYLPPHPAQGAAGEL